ncbi:pentapeptide repeat-containing protein [Amycolatopsis sp. PS_44_ISF1]|uniref:pentapeptide repeat-containing protein n=1 Tax=Amycolatopsis sp. PS_44_ISF1 TaxID=2974917 RepID=UPI0028DF93BA|nr:pentapeptide repeat-containing protein [Amycolatopsis sp. PS_44_ISF1]MDT8911463.1 pentapeptide repeat-containing protein [Amycolatopsis sp. PS_44_ISF1]
MTNRSRALRTGTILWWGAGLVLVAVAAAVLLLSTLGGGRPQDSARLDALRTAANVVVGTGGAAALLLAARRQRSAELDLEQKDHDATQRRITEMYGKAADQLGSGQAPVRLAGLYALERLAQEHPFQRQTIVNLLCAYLRLPFRTDRGERQVRQAAQRILTVHLHPAEDGGDAWFWPDVDLDLTGARLADFSFKYCRVRSAVFAGATFTGVSTFRGAAFATKADFAGATFTAPPDFAGAAFPPGVGAPPHRSSSV